MNTLYNLIFSIQVVLINFVTLVMQPLWFIYNVIMDIIEIWSAKEEDEQPKEEDHHIGFHR